MPPVPVTDFAVKDPYEYLWGLGNYHQSEALPGANLPVINSPQKIPYSLRTERISNSSFVGPRHSLSQTWMYRTSSSLWHTPFAAWTGAAPEIASPAAPSYVTPNSYLWPSFKAPRSGTSWPAAQRLLARNGNPLEKRGLAIYVFAVTAPMDDRTAFSSLDGETLIVPQAGALDVQTEMGRIMVRQNELCVIPRGVRYRVGLVAADPENNPAGGKLLPCRGWVCELFEGVFTLPELGPIGSTGLANARDFQIPVACFDGTVDASDGVAKPNPGGGGGDWTIISRLGGSLHACTQPTTPFDVAGWHGTCYPYKFDLARYCVLGNMAFDEHDPSLYVVLTAPAHGKAPGTAVLDVAILPPRWFVGQNTYREPYYHRNVMQEFYGIIVNDQRPEYPFSAHSTGATFAPLGCGLNGCMTTHGASEAEYTEAMALDTTKPSLLQDDGMTIFLLETEMPLFVSDWAAESGVQNFRVKGGMKPKM